MNATSLLFVGMLGIGVALGQDPQPCTVTHSVDEESLLGCGQLLRTVED